MTRLKYIMLDIDGLPTPVVFPDTVQHSTIAQACENAGLGTPRSAGFFTFDSLRVRAFGMSDTLDMKPSVDDNMLLTMYFRHGSTAQCETRTKAQVVREGDWS